mmetsp:Transcript_105162/g.279899  ORF Transcript_105162/g.279899 Transcript_105162/m.279899 type:complete len:383 (-) Transcript_105162:214-1362(-)
MPAAEQAAPHLPTSKCIKQRRPTVQTCACCHRPCYGRCGRSALEELREHAHRFLTGPSPDAAEQGLELLRRRPLRGREDQAPQQQLPQGGRDLRQELHVWQPPRPAHGSDHLRKGEVLVRQRLRKHLPEHDAEGEDVRLRADGLVAQRLRSRPVRGPAAVVRGGVRAHRRVAKITDLRNELLRGGVVNQDIGRLQISMDQPQGMHVAYSAADAVGQPKRTERGELPKPSGCVRSVNEVKEGAVHELGEDVLLAAVHVQLGADAEEAAEVRVAQRRHDAALLEQLVDPHGPVALHVLDGHPVLLAGVELPPALARPEQPLVDEAEAALGELALHLQLIQWDHKLPENGIVHGVGQLVPLHWVLQSVQFQKSSQGFSCNLSFKR